MAVSRPRRLNHADENAYVVGGKSASLRPKPLTARGVLGEVNANSESQRILPGDGDPSANQIEKKKTQRTALRRAYSHVKSKVDTGNTARTIQPSARPPLRREESTGGLASRAALITKAAGKELKIDKENQKENIKVTKKSVRSISLKESKEKRNVKDTAESLRQLKLVENNHCIQYEEPLIVLPADIEDIDVDEDSPLLMSIYIKDIYRYLTHLETLYPIEENYLKNQNVITGNMRATLIDWLVEIQNQFSLLAETFQLAVGIIDRYLQAVPNLKKEHLQLVGVTSTLLASKYEEIFPPSIDDFVYVTDNTYTRNDIIKCEIQIMKKMEFCMSRPIPISFLRRFVKAAHGSSKNHHLAKYLVDLCLVEYSMAHYRPSELAAAAICLSLHLLSKTPLQEIWTPTLTYYSEYKFSHIEPIIKKIVKIVYNLDKSKFTAVKQKYAQATLAKVSTLPQLKGPAIAALLVQRS